MLLSLFVSSECITSVSFKSVLCKSNNGKLIIIISVYCNIMGMYTFNYVLTIYAAGEGMLGDYNSVQSS